MSVNMDPAKVLYLCNRIKSVKGVFAGASDLMEMSWDIELQEMAQRWANQCPNASDSCRNTARGEVNQIVDSVINEEFVLPTWESVFLKWYIEDIPSSVINEYADGRYRALSQLIWGETRWVGCGASSHIIEVGRVITLVCNYSPPGNVPSQPVFNIKGGMCTNCPKGSFCSDKQNVNLCVPLGVPKIAINNILLFIANILIFLSV
ncbi:venom allergen 5.02-like isoform X2 [Cimex lectularius]|nr:venom allergen 5.02-like isoform X2 [Cimex lectularius]